MKHSLNLLAILAFVCLFSCSKQESTSETTEIAEASTPGATPAPNSNVIELSPEQVERVAFDVLQRMRDMLLMEDPDLTAYVEEFSIEGNIVRFKLLRHNGDDAGWHSDQEEEEDPPYAEEIQRQQEEEAEAETEEDRKQREIYEEQMAEEEERMQEYRERYGAPQEEEQEPTYSYTNQIDTFAYEGPYTAYLNAGAPESTTARKITIIFSGQMVHSNGIDGVTDLDEPVDETELARKSFVYNVPDVVTEIGSPLVVDRAKLYVKAKYTDLTPADVAGMTKEELGFLRNEIFARHGHTFKTPKMMDYFNNKRWYMPIDNDAQPLLNKFEKRNVEFLKKKEG